MQINNVHICKIYYVTFEHICTYFSCYSFKENDSDIFEMLSVLEDNWK
jgi:hypothetical protein